MKILFIGGCGYIGSYLVPSLQEQHEVDVVDTLLRGVHIRPKKLITLDYGELSAKTLGQYDTVIWFAGHSSVANSQNDPKGALLNNCLNLSRLALALKPGTKFIYASSASLYSTPTNKNPSNEAVILTEEVGMNAYDATKFAFDYIAKNFLENYFALRMGTLCGWSPNMRRELVFNAMHISAKDNKYVNVMNGSAWRSILYLTDLWSFIDKSVNQDIAPGVYNLCSESYSISELGVKIAKFWDAEIQHHGNSQTYSFIMDNTKMKSIVPYLSNFNDESNKLKQHL